MHKNHLLLLTLFFLSVGAFAQPTFEKSYGAPGYGENQDDIKKLKQNHLLITGSTSNYGAGSYDAYCIVIDEKGRTLWSKTYGTSYSNGFTKCWGTADSGFVICFTSYAGTYLYGDSISGIFVVKCSKDGQVQWSKCIKSVEPLKNKVSITPAYIYESKKGDIYVLCDWFSFSFAPDFSLTKLDKKGNLKWNTSVAQNFITYEYHSVQIAETGNGDVVVAENAYGDDYYTFGNYIHLLLFSQATGIIRISNHIAGNDKDGTSYVSAANIVTDNNKIRITSGFSQGNKGGICWFSISPNDDEVKAKYMPYSNQLSYQYLINKQLIQQPEEGFDNRTVYTKGGGYLFTYTGGSPDYNILLDRYDSLGRLCPMFVKQPAIDTNQYKTTIEVTYQPYFIFHNTFVALDTSVTVTSVAAEKTVCEGSVSTTFIEPNKTINTLSNQLDKAGIQLYPNPSADVITITYETDRAAKIEIDVTTIEGKRVMTKEVFAGKGKQQTTLHSQSLPPGIYFIKVSGLIRPEVLPFVKE